MSRSGDWSVLLLTLAATVAVAGLTAGGEPGIRLAALAGFALPALLLVAVGPRRPRWLRWIYLALALDLVASGVLLLALRSEAGARLAGLPTALVVQGVGLWLLPFLLTAVAALAAGRRR